MDSLQIGHPEDDRLLRYADGELAAGDAAQVRIHLEACWQCRQELTEVQKVVGRCVEYREQMQAHLPPPPEPWVDLHRRMSEIDTALAGGSFSTQLKRLFHPGIWVPAAVAAVLMAGIYYQFRHAPSVRAAELLRKAAAAEDSRHV